MTTIRKVSELAGVSIATVSRALSKPEKVSKEAYDRVMAAVKEANYQPNLLARNFRSARSYSVVVLVPNIANPFFSRVIKGIETAAQEAGYAVLLGDTRGEQKRETEYFRLLETRQADGAIQLSSYIPETLIRDGELLFPLVNACECQGDTPAPTVQVDNAAGSAALTRHLTMLGHKNIAVILGPEESPLTGQRLSGYKQALSEASITFNPNLLVQGDYSMRSGRDAAARLLELDPKPTAVVCMNDEMAIGLIRGFKLRGIRVPDDISVAGFDDIEFSKYCDPPLTTIAQPAEEIGSSAMAALIDVLNGQESHSKAQVLPIEFIVRESTGPVKN